MGNFGVGGAIDVGIFLLHSDSVVEVNLNSKHKLWRLRRGYTEIDRQRPAPTLRPNCCVVEQGRMVIQKTMHSSTPVALHVRLSTRQSEHFLVLSQT